MINAILSVILSLSPNNKIRATHYGARFEDKIMANGRPYSSRSFTAASNTYPLGTRLRVMNLLNGKIIYVRVTDTGRKSKRFGIDLSEIAFDTLGFKRKKGWGWVSVEIAAPVSE